MKTVNLTPHALTLHGANGVPVRTARLLSRDGRRYRRKAEALGFKIVTAEECRLPDCFLLLGRPTAEILTRCGATATELAHGGTDKVLLPVVWLDKGPTETVIGYLPM